MPENFIQMPPDSTGKKIRTRERTVGANIVQEQYVITQNERVITNTGFGTTPRTVGAAALTHNLFSIENTTGSTVLLAVRRLVVQLDATAALAAVMPLVKTYRIASATGGTTLAKGQFDTSQTSSANVILRGAAATDGGAATAITLNTPSSPLWQQFCMRMHTLAGQVIAVDSALVPTLSEDTPVILRAGQGLGVQVVAAATTSNPASNHWFVQCVWEEFTLP